MVLLITAAVLSLNFTSYTISINQVGIQVFKQKSLKQIVFIHKSFVVRHNLHPFLNLHTWKQTGIINGKVWVKAS